MDLIPECHDLGYEMTNNLDLYNDTIISCCIYQYHVISWDMNISWHIVLYHAVSCCIISSERFSDAERHCSPCDVREEAYVCFIVRAVNLLVQVVEYSGITGHVGMLSAPNHPLYGSTC